MTRRMQLAIGGHDAAVGQEFVAVVEFERPAHHVGDACRRPLRPGARRRRGPRFFPCSRTWRAAACKSRPRRGRRSRTWPGCRSASGSRWMPRASATRGRQAGRRVARFDRLAKAGLDGVGRWLQWTAVGAPSVVERHDPASAAAHGVKDRAGRRGRSADQCRVVGLPSRQIRAAEQGDLDSAVDDQGSEMAYCSCRRKPLVPSIGSRVQNRGAYFFSQPRSIQSQASSPLASTPIAAQLVQHALEERGVFFAAEGSRFFLADDRVARERRRRSADRWPPGWRSRRR